jgi:GTP-binding protein
MVHWGYGRYLENKIREEYGYKGTPLKVIFRSREQKEARDERINKRSDRKTRAERETLRAVKRTDDDVEVYDIDDDDEIWEEEEE